MRKLRSVLVPVALLAAVGCGQNPRLDIIPVIQGGRVVFNIPHSDVNGLLGISVDDVSGNTLWSVGMSYEKGGRIVYGVLPTGGNTPAKQDVPPAGQAPPDIRGKTVRVRVTYQYDSFGAASAGNFTKTVAIP